MLIAGDHVPVIAGLFVDDVGSAGIVVEPEQYGPTDANVGVTGAFTVTILVAVASGQPAVVLATV